MKLIANHRLPMFVCLFVATAASMGLAGALSNRWGIPEDLSAAADRLERVPAEFGPWELMAEQELDPHVRETLECAGAVVRVYRHRENKDRIVRMALFVGPPGPISVHTPEICYSSQDFTVHQSPSHVGADGLESRKHQFWSMTLKSNSVAGQMVEVAYGWNAGRGWLAPRKARFSFGGEAKLYKLQIATDADPREARHAAGNSACQEFLRDVLPILDRVLFSEGDAGKASAAGDSLDSGNSITQL